MDPIETKLREAGPAGSFWLDVGGPSLVPLARAGDAVRIRPCAAGDLRAGDLALVRQGRVWAVRVVEGVRPLRTAALWAAAAPEDGVVHGRVAEVRRGRRVVALGAPARALLTGARAARGALRSAREAVRPLTAPVRALRLGPLEIRPVRPEDEAELDRFCAANLRNARALVLAQLRGRWRTDGVPMAAFDRRGAVVAFMFADAYAAEGVPVSGRWLRTLSVAPRARRLGVGRRLILAVADECRRRGWHSLRGGGVITNHAVHALLRGVGFREAGPEVQREANDYFRSHGMERMNVLELVLNPRDGGGASG